MTERKGLLFSSFIYEDSSSSWTYSIGAPANKDGESGCFGKSAVLRYELFSSASSVNWNRNFVRLLWKFEISYLRTTQENR
ncbi:hypothetical protein JTE90_011363 [Oedothorax gibbosus]|uniref:Uncharacterized protein n=1 Tax=Oedothorax gibbosus TaxID=931172 RepID=A0AAV6VNB3_9ARAC|nr:hypothetical protein JTE90_011363 [Oedothorax gibbosus]